jgi:hypothetical protein
VTLGPCVTVREYFAIYLEQTQGAYMRKRIPLAKQLGGKDLNPVWVSSFWDFPREGLCIFGNKLCRFRCVFNEKSEPQGYEVFALSRLEKMLWLWRKREFEICVGYHWTYPNRVRGERFRPRNPRWLHFLLFALHYRSLSTAYSAFYRHV